MDSPCVLHGRFRFGESVVYNDGQHNWREGTVVGSHFVDGNNHFLMIWIEHWDKSRVQILASNVRKSDEPRPCPTPPQPPCPPQPECPNFVKDVLAHVVAARRIIDSSYGWPLGVREAFQLLGQAQEYLASACPQPPPCPPAQPMRYWILREGSPLTGQMFATIQEARSFRDGLEPATRQHALIIDLLMLIVT